jgi:hypothetical protein
MKDEDYKAILGSLDASLSIIGSEVPPSGKERLVYEELLRIRETLIRTQRDFLQNKQRDSRSPLGKA